MAPSLSETATHSLLMLSPLSIILLLPTAVLAEEEEMTSSNENSGEEEFEQAYAVLFPWFSEAVGVIVLFLLTRNLPSLPYTAVMFLIGMAMGVGAARTGLKDQLTSSILQWGAINGEVVLLVFLPGLLFRDAFTSNVHLLMAALSQCLILAFPMVLAGTTLTACVGYFIFPYEWSWNLSMTFGSILAATDPVAVAALLDEVGAPPRLKTLISGESMFNDGSAVVFYTIFSSMFLAELNIPYLGETVDVGQGFAMFFRMSLGAVAVGIAFGLGLLIILFYLNRRLETEENVIQVAAAVTVAYLSFYTAEIVLEMSGIITCISCAIVTKSFGSGMINDRLIMDSFWILVEQLLNTLLFTLGGAVWGSVIANTGGRQFDGSDWGYLVVLYLLVQAIRFLLMAIFYPILSRTGLGINCQEGVFLSYGGLRGAVGIALALSLDNEVWSTTTDEVARDYTNKLFGMVGGVAFMTLVINGSFAGPVLRKLGLAKSSETRSQVVNYVERALKTHILDEFVELLADARFRMVDFAVIRHHVPLLRYLTLKDLKLAVQRYKENTPPCKYKKTNLEKVLPYLNENDEQDVLWAEEESEVEEADPALAAKKKKDESSMGSASVTNPKKPAVTATPNVDGEGGPEQTAKNASLATELRISFLELLRNAYQQQVDRGELDARELDGFLLYVLLQSIDFATDEASRGQPLNDWKLSQIVSNTWTDRVRNIKKNISRCFHTKSRHLFDDRALTLEYKQLRLHVLRALTFIRAHRQAQGQFKTEFIDAISDTSEFMEASKLVMDESESEIRLAQEVLRSYDIKDVKVINSHLFCSVLLNKTGGYIELLSERGLLKDREAHTYIEEIEDALLHVRNCSQHEHPGEFRDKGLDEEKGGKCKDEEDDDMICHLLEGPL